MGALRSNFELFAHQSPNRVSGKFCGKYGITRCKHFCFPCLFARNRVVCRMNWGHCGTCREIGEIWWNYRIISYQRRAKVEGDNLGIFGVALRGHLTRDRTDRAVYSGNRLPKTSRKWASYSVCLFFCPTSAWLPRATILENVADLDEYFRLLFFLL